MKSKQTRKENKTSPAKIAANKRYNDSKTDVLQCRVKKSENINQRIDDAVKAIQETTGNDKYSKAAFILDAIRAKLDGPQPVQVPQPQPPATTATAATAPALTIQYPPDMLYNERIQLLIDAGITSSVSEYVLSVIGENLDRELSFNGVSLWRYEHGTTEPRHK